MLHLQNLSYSHSNKTVLFQNLQLHLHAKEKMAIIGNNGVGKSTLLKIIAGEFFVSAGQLKTSADPYYIPQIFGQFNDWTIAKAMRVETKWKALKSILNGNVSELQLELLQDDWTIEDRCREALAYWQLFKVDLDQTIGSLSGGQKTKVFLAGIQVHQPDLILLDEPSNYLDLEARNCLYQFLQSCSCAMIVVSHDRNLLNLLDAVGELNATGIKYYGGNYEFYLDQKKKEHQALQEDIAATAKSLRIAKEIDRETKERQNKLNARGKNKQEKSGVAKIMMNTLRNNAEKTSAKLKNIHAEKVQGLKQELQSLRSAIPNPNQMKMEWDASALHVGKRLFAAEGMNIQFAEQQALWKKPISWLLNSGERWVIKGKNGVGKTTLLQILLGSIEPTIGSIFRSECRTVYIDQEYSLVNRKLTVYELAREFNRTGFEEHEINIRLHRFLFDKGDWNTSCQELSGGERMRLLLCCLNISQQSPDLILLDEPTNNLDLENLEILTKAINQYKGTLIVVSHDENFLKDIKANSEFTLE
ncbi:ABC-F family ATP-binding cassette domain-containing protein [Flavihumibacter sp. UBA7668]|uniref:ABC-F family ATP-binding cassette domain-containing protein n=1 Tax=Flavihumibacter sp. UBA7668 TaxID=1946542 RepID=UPI0025BFD6D1|nr:ABC-F family ATP-binding cassette domain-containing protein [Flavihumibacter sp. UBA7668]